MKATFAFNEMTSIPKLLNLYKCMDKTCPQTFENKELFKLHIQSHFSMEKQIDNTEQFKMCAYCFQIFDDADSLANHIDEKYSFCEYLCPYCFYRAYTPSHVLVHQSLLHSKEEPSIIKLEHSEGVLEYPKELLLAVDFNEFVIPYVCNVGDCTFSCWLHDDFLFHLKQQHQFDNIKCFICANFGEDNGGKEFIASQPESFIEHLKLHNINMYQCIFCLFGTEVIDSMISHLAMEHFEYELLCLKRTSITNPRNAEKIEDLNIIKINKTIKNGIIKNLPAEISSLVNVTLTLPNLKSVSTQLSDLIVIKVPHKEDMSDYSIEPSDNEFIILDDDDIILIDDDDDDIILIDDDDNTSNKKETSAIPTNNAIVKQSINGSTKAKRLALPLVTLDKLFTCKQCDKVFKYSEEYQTHLQKQCPFWNSNGQKCAFCPELFKTVFKMIEHLKLHGPDRFKCTLCNITVPSCRAIIVHMEQKHNATEIDFVPAQADLINFDSDEFFVYIKKTNEFDCQESTIKSTNQKSMDFHMMNVHQSDNIDIVIDDKLSQHNKVRRTESNKISRNQLEGVKKIYNNDHSDNICNSQKSSKLKDNPNKTNLLSFSPETIDSIPANHIFSEPIGCSLCTYNTKLRSDLVAHLEGHIKGQINTTKEIVNPVPSIGKSELMYDKSINLSASSYEAMENVHVSQIINANENENSVAQSNKAHWICNICSSGIKYTENEITSHISKDHKVSNMFKCPICLFNHKNDDANIFKNHYKSNHPNVAPKCLKVFEKITEIEDQQKQPIYLHDTANIQEALDSIDPTLVPPTCRGIPINKVSKTKTRNKSRAKLKRSKAKAKMSPLQPNKQKMLTVSFSKNDSLGSLSANGLFVCPRCNLFETSKVKDIRMHLYEDVQYEIRYKCLKCFEVSDSLIEMACHVENHGLGIKYQKIDDDDKFEWVERVIHHQTLLLKKFKKNHRNNNSIEQKRLMVTNKRSFPPLKKNKVVDSEDKILDLKDQCNDIINLLDDSDDE